MSRNGGLTPRFLGIKIKFKTIIIIAKNFISYVFFKKEKGNAIK